MALCNGGKRSQSTGVERETFVVGGVNIDEGVESREGNHPTGLGQWELKSETLEIASFCWKQRLSEWRLALIGEEDNK